MPRAGSPRDRRRRSGLVLVPFGQAGTMRSGRVSSPRSVLFSRSVVWSLAMPFPAGPLCAFTLDCPYPVERRLRRVSKDEGTFVAPWFETAQERLLTMRENVPHFADFAKDCHLLPSAI